MLRRLDDLGAYLAGAGDAWGLLGLGSAGVEHDRMDEHSDLDFFVVVRDSAAKDRYLASIEWLGSAGEVAYSFANDRNGRKVLFADGVFAEYAVFTPDELSRLAFTGARVVWQSPDCTSDLAHLGPAPGGPPFATVEFHLNEALTNLYVGLHRERRGERLTAARFIQVYAVDRAICLLNLERSPDRRDPFDTSRRVEQAYAPDVLPLSDLMPGYEHSAAAAEAMLAWLLERYPADPVIVAAIREQLRLAGSAAELR
jgi:hypothetical protein